jgi:SAM-dependent methyltransferase
VTSTKDSGLSTSPPSFPPTDTVRQQFGPVASAYASSDYHSSGPDLAKLVEGAGLTGKERVIDIGCGAGHTAIALAPHAAQVTAVDITPEMLAVAADLAARRGLTNIDFERQDATKLPYPDARFDVAASRVAAHHYHDLRAFVAEAARVLKPGGRLMLADTIAPEDPALDTFCNAFELLRDPSHVRNWRVSEWSALMREHGLEPEVLYQFDLELEMGPWFERQQTVPDRRTGVVGLFAGANEAARAAFHLDARPGWFTLPIALIRATRR